MKTALFPRLNDRPSLKQRHPQLRALNPSSCAFLGYRIQLGLSAKKMSLDSSALVQILAHHLQNLSQISTLRLEFWKLRFQQSDGRLRILCSFGDAGDYSAIDTFYFMQRKCLRNRCGLPHSYQQFVAVRLHPHTFFCVGSCPALRFEHALKVIQQFLEIRQNTPHVPRQKYRLNVARLSMLNFAPSAFSQPKESRHNSCPNSPEGCHNVEDPNVCQTSRPIVPCPPHRTTNQKAGKRNSYHPPCDTPVITEHLLYPEFLHTTSHIHE